MKFHFFLILFFILVNKINAMDLLQNIESENSLKKWEFVSDKVMGGISEGKFEILKDKKNNFLRLSGIVSTENNGGFIQIRTNFDVNEENFTRASKVKTPFTIDEIDKEILKDNSHFRVYEPYRGFVNGRSSYFHNSISGYHAAKPKRIQDLYDFYLLFDAPKKQLSFLQFVLR